MKVILEQVEGELVLLQNGLQVRLRTLEIKIRCHLAGSQTPYPRHQGWDEVNSDLRHAELSTSCDIQVLLRNTERPVETATSFPLLQWHVGQGRLNAQSK